MQWMRLHIPQTMQRRRSNSGLTGRAFTLCDGKDLCTEVPKSRPRYHLYMDGHMGLSKIHASDEHGSLGLSVR